MLFKDIEQLVIQWGIDRDLYTESDDIKQFDKLKEELEELHYALCTSDRTESIDAIGDMIVVLTHIAKFLNTDLTSCYLHAYNEIKDRKGKIVKGIFVKEL